MDRYCVITNYIKDENRQYTNFIKDYLESRNKVCALTFAERKTEWNGYWQTNTSLIPDDTECIIVLGGDGTIIQVASDLLEKQIPIIGINLGTLGFLAEIEKHNIEKALECLLNDDYTIEKRMMLYGKIQRNHETIYEGAAINDIIISKSGFSNISVQIFLNDELVDTYRGDGVIIATPTGSTAYNLSAGGPIVKPSTKAMIITPICPHMLNTRSIVVSSEDKIVAQIGKPIKARKEELVATYDGRGYIELKMGDTIEICKAEKETKLIKLNNISFFDILRNKLYRDKE